MQRNYFHPFVRTATAALLGFIVTGCGQPTGPVAIDPAASTYARGGNSGGGSGSSAGGGVVQGDLTLADGDAPALVSTCPSASFTANGWAMVFGKSGCLLSPTLWTSSTYAAYKVADDVVLQVLLEKGKNGRITHVKLNGQDVDGEAGIWHTTYWIPVAQPVVPSKAGFTLHVHARNVAVWRTDSHLGGGNPVEVVGLISIGDMLYPPR